MWQLTIGMLYFTVKCYNSRHCPGFYLALLCPMLLNGVNNNNKSKINVVVYGGISRDFKKWLFFFVKLIFKDSKNWKWCYRFGALVSFHRMWKVKLRRKKNFFTSSFCCWEVYTILPALVWIFYAMSGKFCTVVL